MSVAELRAHDPVGTDEPRPRASDGRPSLASADSPPARLTYERVLVPTDGSEPTLAALDTARSLAAALGADVHTLAVAVADDDVDRLHASVADVVGSTVDDPRVAVRVGDDPGDAIVARAIELDPALVSLVTRARGRVGRAVFGSVAATILEHGRPVLALGPRATRPSWSPQTRSWPAPLSGPVTAYVDGSPSDDAVVDWATAFARELGVPMTILAVVPDAPEPLRAGPADRRPEPRARAHVDALLARSQEGTDVAAAIRRDPLGVASGIASHLETTPGGLLVVSTRLDHELPGSIRPATAAAIVRESPVPSLVVPVGSGSA